MRLLTPSLIKDLTSKIYSNSQIGMDIFTSMNKKKKIHTKEKEKKKLISSFNLI